MDPRVFRAVIRSAFLIFLGVFLVSVYGTRKPCNFTVSMSGTLIKYNSSIDADVRYNFGEIQSVCYMNLDEIYQNLTDKLSRNLTLHRKTMVFFLYFNCWRAATDGNYIHFTSLADGNSSQGNISVNIMIRLCKLYVKELYKFRLYGPILSITAPMYKLLPDPDCSSLKETVNIHSNMLCNNDHDYASVQMKGLFWEYCKQSFEKVVSLRVIGCSNNYINVRHNLLQNKFPKLQVLYLKHVNMLRVNITFPWANVSKDNPDNTTNSLGLNFESKSINSSRWHRTINIYDSKVSPPSFKFDGYILGISLSGIGLKVIEEDKFINVCGLNYLDLSNNALEVIETNVFQKLTNLQYLHLGNNQISYLAPGCLDSMHNLLKLDLSRNRINIFDQSLLKNLLKLEEIVLERNDLTELSDDFLKDQIHSLVALKLSWNPLKTIPVYPFYSSQISSVDLSHCKINSTSFEFFLQSLHSNKLQESYIERMWEQTAYEKAVRTKVSAAVLNISFCEIKKVETFDMTMTTFIFLMTYFRIDFTGNPIDCTCIDKRKALTLSIVKRFHDSLNWVCKFPQELKGRPFISLTLADSYCPTDVENCPKRCSCYARTLWQNSSNTIKQVGRFIVDCRNVNITKLPEKMPTGKLELWFSNAGLTKINAREYFRNTEDLDVSHNRINEFTTEAALGMKKLTSLKLDHNNLTRLPVQISSANISSMTLGDNPYCCDCHTKWMKNWLIKRTSPVKDWNTVKCSYDTRLVKKMADFPDTFFVCVPSVQTSIAGHVVLPAVVIGCVLFVLVSVSLLIYLWRFEIKVLLFMYFGIHPFDKRKHIANSMEYDIFLIYSRNDSTFIRTNILDRLKNKGYRVCNLYEDLVVGFSCLRNIEMIMNKSRQTIFSWTEDILTDELLIAVWNLAVETTLNNLSDSFVLIVDSQVSSKCEDKTLKNYIKCGRFVKRESTLLFQSVLYLIPQLNKDQGHRLTEEYCSPMIAYDIVTNDYQNNLVYMIYPDELEQAVRQTLIPDLQRENFEIRLFDQAFIPGTDIRDEIDNKLNSPGHFLFIFSTQIIEDGVKMYILSSAISKSTLANNNYLLLVTHGEICHRDIPNLVANYLNKHVTASFSDPILGSRILKALKY